jgi:type IV pilus assembly protein PilQ
VIREISRQTGRDVVADGVLERTVSLSLRETSVDEALDALALACGLTLEKSGGLIRATDGRANSLPGYGQSAFEVIRLKHITAAGARNSLPDVLLRYLHLDAGENALTVSGPQSVIAKVRKDLALLDRPVPQIEVEALIVEFTATDDRNRLWRGEQRWDGERLGVDAGTGDIVFETASELQAGFATSLQALVQSGRARVRARPRAVAKNGETAKLFVGQQKFIKVAEYNAFEEADYGRIMGVDLGASLTEAPWTGDSREITVDIVPEVSSIAEREPRTGLPTVFTRNAHATLRLRSGDTVMIGGLVDDQPERRRRRIPILGSLPLIGPFFHTVEARRVRHELTIFLPARVQDGAAQPSPLTLSGPGTDHGDTR